VYQRCKHEDFLLKGVSNTQGPVEPPTDSADLLARVNIAVNQKLQDLNQSAIHGTEYVCKDLPEICSGTATQSVEYLMINAVCYVGTGVVDRMRVAMQLYQYPDAYSWKGALENPHLRPGQRSNYFVKSKREMRR
jgi:hypothetical protein